MYHKHSFKRNGISSAATIEHNGNNICHAPALNPDHKHPFETDLKLSKFLSSMAPFDPEQVSKEGETHPRHEV